MTDSTPATAAPMKHDPGRHPHHPLSSFTCPACIRRCHMDDQGRGELGRVHISKNAARWAKEDGYVEQ